jgi:hypothetical protein
VKLLEQAVAIRAESLGPDHASTLAAMEKLARALDTVDRKEEAVVVRKRLEEAAKKAAAKNQNE